jgi:hypothetical protein
MTKIRELIARLRGEAPPVRVRPYAEGALRRDLGEGVTELVFS